MPVFIIYKDLTCNIEITKDFYNRNDILFAVGGIALAPFVSYEGFKKSNLRSLEYSTDRIAICYNPKTNKIAFAATEKNINIYEFKSKLIKLGFSVILGLDSGGSAQWRFENSKRFTHRYMIGWLCWDK